MVIAGEWEWFGKGLLEEQAEGASPFWEGELYPTTNRHLPLTLQPYTTLLDLVTSRTQPRWTSRPAVETHLLDFDT